MLKGFRLCPAWKHAGALVLFLLATSMVFVACGGGDEQQKAPMAMATTEPPPTSTAPAAPSATAQTQRVDTPTPAPPAQAGHLAVAVDSVGSPSGLPRDCPQCEILTFAEAQDTLLQFVRGADGTPTAAPGLATSWRVSEDGSYIEFAIRRGVPFHGDWGELTANDVAWTYNEMMAPASVHATKGESIGAGLKTENTAYIHDPYTVRVNWEGFSEPGLINAFADYYEGVGVFSKRVHAEMGAEWMRNNPIGTGPFKVVRWDSADRLALEAVESHWRQTPSVKKATYFEVPEISTRKAMLTSGQVQIAMIGIEDWPPFVGEGGRFKLTSEGASTDQAFPFGGNYWEKVHPLSGAPLQRELHADTLAWVGDPYELGDQFDPNTPSMKRARKVRQALSITVDREGLNKALFGGLARVSYMGGVHEEDPVWKNIVEPIPWDPAAAKKLLTEAGYEKGFKIGFYATTGGSTADQVARALAAGWKKELNVNVEIINMPYAAYRPHFINRTVKDLEFRRGGVWAPSTWQEEFIITAIPSNKDGTPGGGFAAGMEIPAASESVLAKRKATTREELVAITEKYMRYMQQEWLWPGVVEYETLAVYDPGVICEYNPLPTGKPWPEDLETVKLCPGVVP